jgi:branched-chain amino acid aminotransferase
MLELLTATTVDLAVSGARHGEGLFETLRVQDGQPWRLAEHLERLAQGAAFLGLAPPPPAAAVAAFLAQTGGSGLAAGSLRLLAVDGHLHVILEPGRPRTPARIEAGLSTGSRRYSGSPLNRFKTLSYLENRLLAREAAERGLFEVVAGNERGQLTDGGRTSLFAVLGGELLTPPVADGALPGVARRVLLQAGLAREASLRPEDLAQAPALLLTNALRGGLPVHRWQGRELQPEHPLLARARLLLG